MMYKGFLLLTLLISCVTHKEIIVSEKGPFPHTVIPESIEDLWVAEGDKNSDTVLIYSQGGPEETLFIEKDGKVLWRYMPNYENYYVVHLHQSQTLNPDFFTYEKVFSSEIAKKEIDTTIDILILVINHFKQLNKTVIVLGHSYGTYCVIRYLAENNNSADKYILCAGRIDSDLNATSSFLMGINGMFKEGKNFVEMPIVKEDHTISEIRKYKIRQMLKGVIGKPRYSDQLKGNDLSKLIFFYADNDSRVGSLTSEEIKVLEKGGAHVIATNDDHFEIIKRVVDAFWEGKISL